MKKRIEMAAPYFNEVDRALIHREIDAILDSSLSMGRNVRAFECEFADRVGVKHAIAMNSCTSALEAALLACRVAGREVIIPSETFIATGMAVHLTGGIPVFAEISDSSLCLDLEDVKRRVTPRTAGIILVHMAGLLSPDVKEFRRYCDDNGLFLIEDAAHSPGACLHGQEAGSFGHAGCFSFFPTKVITAGEGGMLTTNDDSIADFARSYQCRGRDMNAQVECYVNPGRNVRMTEMSGLLGRVQLSRLDEFLRRRRALAAAYRKAIDNLWGVEHLLPEDLESSSFWKVPVLLAPELNRLEISHHMAAEAISVDWAYQPALHLQPVFRELYGFCEGLLPRTEELLSRHLCLPCHQSMTEEDVLRVVAALRDAIKNCSHHRIER